MKRIEALGLGLKHYNTGQPCKHGHIATRRTADRVCMKCDLVNKKAKAIANPEAHTIYAQAQYIKHRTVRLAEKKLYRQTSKGLINASSASRKSHIKQRTPAWVDSEELWLIKEVYALATLRTKMFGFSWHVDHIVPLRGKLVSGLHVAINMRVIPANENLKKKNKFEVQNGY